MAELRLGDAAARDDLGAFVARAVRLDQQAVVRLRNRPGIEADAPPMLDAWVSTPFDALVTRSVEGVLAPDDTTVWANDLLTTLTMVRGDRLDPGLPQDLMWRSALPPVNGWQRVDDVPADTIAELADRGVSVARENSGPHGTPPASLLDQTVLTVSGSGLDVKIPLRCLFALSGMGFVGGDTADDQVRVVATDSWLRLDARFGSVVRRRHAMLPLLI
ncbi:hypothetical protein [Actinoalloteichus hymeniacidonis]|uniref:Uncharacterized protein n=1 Tax=Actinoalloteichus hymeniacidonis TaxID=340345 RepID=A0AAC9MXX0_9PSEU|nr:hypothetical protein [Actinoalloteichus hymeniacidonis]AOS62387.1 hypothetical protein TL08_07850 [Actinoalloteichus hymeniacidonis]MBB5909583.1 hypothetical protein [Actinoalloteichus hymeniacidonis]